MKRKRSETWLPRALERLRPIFTDAGYPLPEPIRVSYGFPSHSAVAKLRRLSSETWSGSETCDGSTVVLISPCLSQPDEVLLWLLHELVHVAAKTKNRDAGFGRVWRAIGMDGKKSVPAAGPELFARLARILRALGPYPHAAIDPDQRRRRPHSGKLYKLRCQACGYWVLTVRKYLNTGVPPSHCNVLMTAELA